MRKLWGKIATVYDVGQAYSSNLLKMTKFTITKLHNWKEVVLLWILTLKRFTESENKFRYYTTKKNMKFLYNGSKVPTNLKQNRKKTMKICNLLNVKQIH